MKKTGLVILALIFVFSAAHQSRAAEKIRIAGSGGMIPLVNELAKAYMARNKGVAIEVNQQSIQSTGGITSAAEGKIEIGMANRPFRDKEKDLGLYAVEIASVAVVVGVNKSVAVTEISGENLCRIYSGTLKNWKDLGGEGPIVALTKSDKDSVKETVRKNIACFKELKEPQSVIIVPTSPETAKVLSNRPGSIGFTDSVDIARAPGAIAALKLDGVGPSSENVRSGKYKLTQSYRLVTKGKPAGTVKEFVDFIKGPEGTRIIEANRAVAIR